jgi:hypothetical protein
MAGSEFDPTEVAKDLDRIRRVLERLKTDGNATLKRLAAEREASAVSSQRQRTAGAAPPPA